MKRSTWLLAAIVVASIIIASCATPTPQIVEVEKVVPQTVVVEKEVEKISTVVVEKEVEKLSTVVVEVPAKGEDKSTLNYVFNAEPVTLDPGVSGDYIAYWHTKQMFMALTEVTPDGEVIPALATQWSASPDGLTWTFELRNDVPWVQLNPATGEFQDLGPVTAKDVVYQVQRMLDARTGVTSPTQLYIINGAEAFNKADPAGADFATLRDAVGVQAPDDYTVVFTLTEPAGYFPSIAAGLQTAPVLQSAVEAHGAKWSEPGWIVTNGPLALQEWLHGNRITLVKNPLWPRADEVQIEVFRGVMVSEAGTAMAMYEDNEIDFMGDPGWDVPLPDIPRVKADPALSKEYVQLPRRCIYYYYFMTFKPPFDNALVRRAFSAAIDRQAIVDNVLKGGQLPANSFAPSGVFGHVAGNKAVGGALVMDSYADQVKQAQAWLAEAGYPEGEGLVGIRLLFPTSETHATIAQAIQGMWTAAFPKADVQLENMEWAVYIRTMQRTSPDEDKPHMVRAGYCGTYPDQNNFVALYHSKDGFNWGGYTNPDFDALVEAARKEADPAKRLEMYQQAEAMLIDEDAVIAPIYFWSFVRVYKPWVTKVVTNPGTDPVWQWEIDWEAKKAATGK